MTDTLRSGVLVVVDFDKRKPMPPPYDDLPSARATLWPKGAAAIVGHELRTTLNGLRGMLVLAHHRAADRKQAAQLAQALAAEQRLSEQIEDLLEFVADSPTTAAAPQTIDLHRFLAELLSAARPAAQVKGLDLVGVVEREVPPGIQLDVDRLHRVLRTLIFNAIKFSRDGSVSVVARWSGDTSLAEQMVAFEVTDQGPGIDSQDLERVFLPFQLGNMASTRAQGGLGLGLALVSRWVQAMGARIEVDSAPGQGSTFRVLVPARREAS